MKVSAKLRTRRCGFALVELLTVIAIIAVLATLLSSALSSAKRKARQTASISHLRQISLALNMYLDDHRKRPSTYAALIREKLLTEKALICAEDKLTGNWAGLIEDATPVTDPSKSRASNDSAADAPPVDVAHSYFKGFDVADDIWERIEANPLAGIAACQLHGVGRQSRDIPPSLTAYHGLVFRALKDTSVVSRQVFWQATASTDVDKSAAGQGPTSSFAPTPPTTAPPGDLPLFLDDAQ